MIYTSYFARIPRLPQDAITISICGKAPDWYHGLQYKKLAPKYDFFIKWKANHDNDYYIKCFNEQVLSVLTAEAVVKELTDRAEGKDIVLLCYEKTGDFCHRHLVAEWLRENGFECEEWE